MKKSFFNKRIPTLFALLLLIVGIGAVSLLTGSSNILKSGAAPSEIPQAMRVTNVTDTSFTVTYLTDVATTGSVSFGKDKTVGTVLLDDRDQTTNTPHPSTIHTMTIKNLLPNTTYYFSITSGDTTYMNNTLPFTATTGPPIATDTSSQQTVSGNVPLSDNNNGGNVLVYVQSQNGQTLSTITDAQGNYHLSLANIRTPDFQRHATLNPTDQLTLILTDGLETSHVITTVQDAQSIPAVTLAQDYNFTTAPSPTNQQLANTPVSFPIFSTMQLSGNPSITVPQNDESFVDQQPEFSGTAQPNAIVTITIHSDEAIQTQVTADNNGQWIFRPETPLSAGIHTLTITTPDATGEIKSITQTFTIFPLGSQVFQTATPAATIAPTATPIPTNTPAPTNAPAATSTPVPTTPTMAPSPTIMASLTPTQAPTPTTVMAPDTPTPTTAQMMIPEPTKPPLPSTGNGSIFTIGIISIITTIVGIVIFFVTQGGSSI